MLGTGAAVLAGCWDGTQAAPSRRFGLAEFTGLKALLRYSPGLLHQFAAMGYRVIGVRLAGYARPALNQLNPRVVSMHWKDIDRTRGRSIGDQAVAPGNGEMDHLALLPPANLSMLTWGYVEVDSSQDGLIAARQGAEVIRPALRGRR